MLKKREGQPRLKVLLVDDDESLITFLKTDLEDYHLEILTAGDGARALKILRDLNYQVDVIVTDIVMPKMSGIDLIKIVADETRGKECPLIIGISTQSGISHEEIIGYGASVVLSKPFRSTDIHEWIERLVAKKTRSHLD